MLLGQHLRRRWQWAGGQELGVLVQLQAACCVASGLRRLQAKGVLPHLQGGEFPVQSKSFSSSRVQLNCLADGAAKPASMLEIQLLKARSAVMHNKEGRIVRRTELAPPQTSWGRPPDRRRQGERQRRY